MGLLENTKIIGIRHSILYLNYEGRCFEAEDLGRAVGDCPATGHGVIPDPVQTVVFTNSWFFVAGLLNDATLAQLKVVGAFERKSAFEGAR